MTPTSFGDRLLRSARIRVCRPASRAITTAHKPPRRVFRPASASLLSSRICEVAPYRYFTADGQAAGEGLPASLATLPAILSTTARATPEMEECGSGRKPPAHGAVPRRGATH